MRAKELSHKLGVTQKILNRWREDGMPATRDRGFWDYDGKAVRQWLLETGKAVEVSERRAPEPQAIEDPGGPVHTKIRECAVYFGVHERTVKSWLTDPSFPGRSGKAGDHSLSKGHFPAKAIALWLIKSGKHDRVRIPDEVNAMGAAVQPVPTSRDRLVDVKTEQALIELKRMQGKMIDAEEAIAFYRRTNAYAATMMKTLPAQVLAELPTTVDERSREAIFKATQKVVKQVMRMLAELIEGDKDSRYDSDHDEI